MGTRTEALRRWNNVAGDFAWRWFWRAGAPVLAGYFLLTGRRDLGPVLRARFGHGKPGTFVATQKDCGGRGSCSFYGDFTAQGGSEVKHHVLMGSGHGALSVGQAMPAVDTGDSGLVFPVGGGHDWLYLTGLLIGAVVVLACWLWTVPLRWWLDRRHEFSEPADIGPPRHAVTAQLSKRHRHGDVVAAYWRFEHAEQSGRWRQGRAIAENLWAIEAIDELVTSGHRESLDLIDDLLRYPEADPCAIGEGPLSDLVEDHAGRFAEQIAARAEFDPAWRAAMACLALSDEDINRHPGLAAYVPKGPPATPHPDE